MAARELASILPLARVKAIMKSDDEVRAVAQDAALLVAKAAVRILIWLGSSFECFVLCSFCCFAMDS